MSAVDCVCKKISLKVLQDSLRPLRFPVNKGFPASLTHAQTLPLAILAKTWYTDVTSQEDDKKVIKSGGHRARFDVTMLTNTAI